MVSICGYTSLHFFSSVGGLVGWVSWLGWVCCWCTRNHLANRSVWSAPFEPAAAVVVVVYRLLLPACLPTTCLPTSTYHTLQGNTILIIIIIIIPIASILLINNNIMFAIINFSYFDYDLCVRGMIELVFYWFSALTSLWGWAGGFAEYRMTKL